VCASAADAAIFSDLLPGARPMGMGMAYTAVAEGADAMFYNPAGTAQGDFPVLGGSFGRSPTAVGMLSMQSLAYARPLPVLPGATVGAGFFGVHQANSGDKNEFLLHFSHALRLPQFYLSRPLKVGGNFKFEHVAKDAASGHRLTVGLDGGALLEVAKDLTAGISVLDLTPDVGVPQPSLNLGTAYRWHRRFLFSGDLRVRRNLTQFFPGVEAGFFQNLLKVRLGKGMPVDGAGLLALGAGVNFSPVILDFAMTMPFQGIHRQAGGAQVSLQYRFGAPDFYGLYPGEASRESEDLKSKIIELDKQRQDLQAQVTAAATDKTSLDSQVEAEEARLSEIRSQLRQAEIELEKKNYEAGHPRPPAVEPARAAEPPPGRPSSPEPARSKRPKAAAPKHVETSRFPVAHVVQAGDTLRKLSERYYGDPSQWESIYEANPDKIERGLPVEGTTLTIPKPGRR